MVDGISNVRCFVRVSNYLYEIWDPPEIWDQTELLGIVFHIWRLFFLFLTVIGNCLLFWEVIILYHPGSLNRLWDFMLFKRWSYLSLMTIGELGRTNGNQSGCQEMVRAGAPAIYSGHCVSSFSIPASWAGDSTDRWAGPCRWGGGFRSGDGGQPPGLSSFRTSECAQAPHQHHLYKTLPDVSCG